MIEGCDILGADSHGIIVGAPRMRLIGNYVFEAGGDGIWTSGSGDDSVMEGNIVRDPVGASITIHADSENCVVTGNRTDGAVADNSGTSTVADNDTTAF